MRAIIFSLLLTSCAAPNPLDMVDQEKLKQTLNTTFHSVQEQTEEIFDDTKEGLRQPVNATEKVGRNVKSREEMMREAGGKMIDETP